MAGKTRSKNQQGKYASYKTSQTWATNRRAKLAKHLKAHPNDTQAVAATKNIVYRRKKPTTSFSGTAKRTLKMFKLFEGRAAQNLISSNPIIAAQARMAHKAPKVPSVSAKGMFSLGLRATNKVGGSS